MQSNNESEVATTVSQEQKPGSENEIAKIDPLKRPAKALMMIEALLSLTIIVLLATRAVNILGS
jgi:hypothetical protein